MLDVLGLNADSPYWASSGADRQLGAVVDGLVAALLAQRTRRPAPGGTSPPPTPSATRWPTSASRSPTPPRAPAGPSPERGPDVPGNSQRKGAVRRKGKGNTAGSGGRVRRGLEGKGPTPKAEDRPYHAAHKAKKAAARSRPATSSGARGPGGPAPGRSGWPAATPCWRR